MGWRLFRRIRIAPGVRVNLSRSGPSLSIGPRGFTKTIGGRGVRTTVGIPGTGIYHTSISPWQSGAGGERRRCPRCHRPVGKTAHFCPNCGNAL